MAAAVVAAAFGRGEGRTVADFLGAKEAASASAWGDEGGGFVAWKGAGADWTAAAGTSSKWGVGAAWAFGRGLKGVDSGGFLGEEGALQEICPRYRA